MQTVFGDREPERGPAAVAERGGPPPDLGLRVGERSVARGVPVGALLRLAPTSTGGAHRCTQRPAGKVRGISRGGGRAALRDRRGGARTGGPRPRSPFPRLLPISCAPLYGAARRARSGRCEGVTGGGAGVRRRAPEAGAERRVRRRWGGAGPGLERRRAPWSRAADGEGQPQRTAARAVGDAERSAARLVGGDAEPSAQRPGQVLGRGPGRHGPPVPRRPAGRGGGRPRGRRGGQRTRTTKRTGGGPWSA